MNDRQPVAPEVADFGTAIWNSPDRHRPLTLPFHPRATIDRARYQIVVGHVNFEDRSYNLVLRTLQSPAEVAAIVAGQGNRTAWMVNARAEGWIEHGAAGDQFQFVTAWLQAEEPTS